LPKKYKQDGDTKKLLLRELTLLFSVLRPFVELPDQTLQGYAMALDDLNSPQILSMVPLVLKKRWEFPPQPAELRELVLANDDSLVHREAREDCPKCQGTGFKMVTEDGARRAAPCECRERVRD
jgi:hypothetical protein